MPRWVKGQPSPNPGGRPREVCDLRELARQHTAKAMAALAAVAAAVAAILVARQASLTDPKAPVMATPSTIMPDEGRGRAPVVPVGSAEIAPAPDRKPDHDMMVPAGSEETVPVQPHGRH